MAVNQKFVPMRWQRGVDPLVRKQPGKETGGKILHLEGRPSQQKGVAARTSVPNAESYKQIIPPPQPDSERQFTVLVADDHPVVLEGLVSLVNRQPDTRVVAQARNGRDAVDKFRDHRPDVALVDLRMPIMDGVETLISICKSDSTAHVAILTSYQNEEDTYRALRAGALGFILKDASAEEIAGCIHAVARGQTWIPPVVGAMLAKRVADRELTRRENEVLQLVAEGKSNKEIGAAFDISEATIKVHMTHILEKLKVTGRTEAINVAVKRGIVRFETATAA